VRHQRRKPHKLRLRSSIHDMNPDWHHVNCPQPSAVSGSAIRIG
jgi:hypothetical protein